MILVLVAHG